MIDISTVVSTLIGGLLILLGTLLANYLQYRSEERKFNKQRNHVINLNLPYALGV